MHIETIGLFAIAPGAAGAAAAAVTGDSLTIKNGVKPRILAHWCDYQTGGFFQMNWPSAHDNVRGWRARVVASEVTNRQPSGIPFIIQPQEAISATIAGSATAGDAEQGCLVVAYDSLPGANQNLITWEDLRRRTKQLTTVDVTLAPAGTGNAWSGAELITAESNLLHANTDYAIVGAEFGAECCALAVRGPDSANMRHTIPGSMEFADQSNQWFAWLSRVYNNLRCIPTFNSANKDSTFLDVLQDENNTPVTASIILAELT